jgi:hypothetical protein
MEFGSGKFLGSLLAVILIPLLHSCSGKPGPSDPQIIVELQYVVFACGDDCPKWVPTEALVKYPDDADAQYEAAVHIKAFEGVPQLPDTLGWNGDVIRLEGNYDNDKEVFYYSGFTIIESRHHEAIQ